MLNGILNALHEVVRMKVAITFFLGSLSESPYRRQRLTAMRHSQRVEAGRTLLRRNRRGRVDRNEIEIRV